MVVNIEEKIPTQFLYTKFHSQITIHSMTMLENTFQRYLTIGLNQKLCNCRANYLTTQPFNEGVPSEGKVTYKD